MIGGVVATAGYFLTHKSQTHDPAKHFGETTGPWADGVPKDKAEEYKFRFLTKDGRTGTHGSAVTDPLSVRFSPWSSPSIGALT